MLAKQKLRNGDGFFTTPDARRTVQLLNGSGRRTHASTGVKPQSFSDESYDPRSDSCLKAYIRLIAALAEAQIGSQ